MYNHTEQRWLESTYSAVGVGKVLFSRNVKPGIFGLSIAPKEIFLTYSTHFVFSTIRLVLGNMVAFDMCGKSPITEEWLYGITWKHVHFNIFVLFIADTTSILKLVFPTVYCFCLDGYFCGCVVAIIVTVVVVVVLFIYLFIYIFIYFAFFVCLFIYYFSATSTVVLIFVAVVVIATVAFVVGVILAFRVCLVIVVANLMPLFSSLVLLFVPYWTVNSVDK